MINIEHKTEENKISFNINTGVYSLIVIMKAAYIYLDKFYIFFDYINEDIINVLLKSKVTLPSTEMENVVGEFYNELLNQCLRLDIQSKTSNLRQLIIGRALYTECIETEEQNEQQIKSNSESKIPLKVAEEESFVNDKYQIATSWNENVKYKEESEDA